MKDVHAALPGSVGFAAACERTAATLAPDIARMQRLRQRLEQGLVERLPAVRVLGAQAERLCNTSCLLFGNLSAERVLDRLERAGVLASSGAACSAGGTQPSHGLLAMGLDAQAARGGVRLSLGREHGADDIEHGIAATSRAIGPLLVDTCATAS